MTSSITTSAARTSMSVPLRRTVGLASPITANFSRVLAARYSWTMPIRVFATITNPNRESWMGATTSMITHRDPIRPLNQVKVFFRTMSAKLRELATGASLKSPRSTRALTSSSVSPRSMSLVWLLIAGPPVIGVARPFGGE